MTLDSGLLFRATLYLKVLFVAQSIRAWTTLYVVRFCMHSVNIILARVLCNEVYVKLSKRRTYGLTDKRTNGQTPGIEFGAF